MDGFDGDVVGDVGGAVAGYEGVDGDLSGVEETGGGRGELDVAEGGEGGEGAEDVVVGEGLVAQTAEGGCVGLVEEDAVLVVVSEDGSGVDREVSEDERNEVALVLDVLLEEFVVFLGVGVEGYPTGGSEVGAVLDVSVEVLLRGVVFVLVCFSWFEGGVVGIFGWWGGGGGLGGLGFMGGCWRVQFAECLLERRDWWVGDASVELLARDVEGQEEYGQVS